MKDEDYFFKLRVAFLIFLSVFLVLGIIYYMTDKPDIPETENWADTTEWIGGTEAPTKDPVYGNLYYMDTLHSNSVDISEGAGIWIGLNGPYYDTLNSSTTGDFIIIKFIVHKDGTYEIMQE